MDAFHSARYFTLLELTAVHGEASEINRASYWSPPHQLGRMMASTRFEKVSRYCMICDLSLSPKQDNASFFWRHEPVVSIFRRQFFELATASSHVVVDEAMCQTTQVSDGNRRASGSMERRMKLGCLPIG